MPQRRAVHFPLGSASDLILHYRDVDFYVHRIVLFLHCAYFRACLPSLKPASASVGAASGDTAQQPSSSSSSSSSSLPSSAAHSAPAATAARSSSPASPRSPAKRKRRSNADSSQQPVVSAARPVEDECSHSPAVACLQLPHSFGVVEAEADDLRLFLEHLYFPAAYAFPPFAPRARVDLSVTDHDVLLPAYPVPDYVAITAYSEGDSQSGAGGRKVKFTLLSLIHYFNAERLWQRCVAVIRARCIDPVEAWSWLSQNLSQFGLKREEQWLIRQAARDTHVRDSELYCQYASRLSVPVMLRIMQAKGQSNNRGRSDDSDDSDD